MKGEIEKRTSTITWDSVCIKVNGGHEASCMMGALQFALIFINPRRSKRSSPYHHVFMYIIIIKGLGQCSSIS